MAVVAHFAYKTSEFEDYPEEFMNMIATNFGRYLCEQHIFPNEEDRPDSLDLHHFNNPMNDKTYCIISSEVPEDYLEFLFKIESNIRKNVEELKDLLFTQNIKTNNRESLKQYLKICMRIIARQDKVEEDIKVYKKLLSEELSKLEEEVQEGKEQKTFYSISSDLFNFKQRNNEQGYIDIANNMKKQIKRIEMAVETFKDCNFWTCELDNEDTDFTETLLSVCNKYLIREAQEKLFRGEGVVVEKVCVK